MKTIKKIITRLVMFILGRAFQAASVLDKTILEEISKWDEGLVIRLQVLPKGPSLCIRKKENRIRYLIFGTRQADLTINFKNIEAAFPVMAGLMGTEQGFAQNRMTVKGDIPLAMSLIRCINRLEALLFPAVISRRLLKRVPKMGFQDQIVRLKIYLTGIPLGF